MSLAWLKVWKKAERSPEEAAKWKRRLSYRWKLIGGLFCPSALQALESSVISSAYPYIATDFNEVKQLNWIISAGNLTSAASLALWAQLTDTFGRYFTILAAITLNLLGSAICTSAPTSAFGLLLLGRALQGASSAGIAISIITILADRVSLSDYSLNWNIFTLVSGLSFSLGPVIGGYVTEDSWRWCFAIAIPIAVVAIPLVLSLLRKELLDPQPLPELDARATLTPRARLVARLSTIDYGGQMLFLWGFGLLILGLTWGGGTVSWNSAAVLAPLSIGGVLSVSWILYEHSMSPGFRMSRIFPHQKAMMPWELVSHRDIGLVFLISFASGMAATAMMNFMDLYFALVEKKSSSKTGTDLLYYYLPGLGSGLYMSMFSSNVWPCQTLPTLLLGSITSAIGITVLPWAIHAEYTNLVYGMMVLVGHGIMMRTNPGSLHCLAYFPNMTARITCLLSFANPFGGFVGLTIMTTVFTNKSGIDQQDPKNGMMWAFIALAPFMWLSVLLTPFLGNVWISRDGAHEVVNGAYLWSFVSRKRLTKQRMTRGEGFGFGNIAPIDATKKDENDVEAGSKHLDGSKSIEVALATMPAALILPSSPEYDTILDSEGHGTE